MGKLRFLPILLVWVLLLPAQGPDKPKLYVFLPSTIRPHAMEDILSKACPTLDIRVFPRYREFRDAIVQNQPEALLSLNPVTGHAVEFANSNAVPDRASRLPVYRNSMIGLRPDGEHLEPYVFLGEQEIEIEDLDNMTIGVVDILGRKGMRNFIREKFSGASPSLKTVTKIEDLLHLLQLKYVDAIFVPESNTSYYENNTAMTLKRTELEDVYIGLPVLAANSQKPEKEKIVIDALREMDQDAMNKLGVNKWNAN
jgi:ABC-type amino acid transport substrate-binding protein